MPTAVAVGRARSDLDVMSRAGLPLPRFMDEAAAAVSAVVPFVAGCFSTVDPATVMIAGTHKLGDLSGRNEADARWAQIEYGGAETTTFAAMHATGRAVLGVHDAMDGEVERSPRMAEVVVPGFGFRDEARVLLVDRGEVWGALAIFRGSDDQPFSRNEISFLSTVVPELTRGVRTGLLAQIGSESSSPDAGPAVLIVDSQDRIVQVSPGAVDRLVRVQHGPGGADPLTAVHALVSAARRFAAGEAQWIPRVRARTVDGVWLVMHAAPLGGAADRAGDVVVTIEDARPHEVIDLVAGAFGLSAREREVVALLLRGSDTREIAAAMHVSPWTVQDHLKSIFTKAGVTSRRELVARVYFDQYVSRA